LVIRTAKKQIRKACCLREQAGAARSRAREIEGQKNIPDAPGTIPAVGAAAPIGSTSLIIMADQPRRPEPGIMARARRREIGRPFRIYRIRTRPIHRTPMGTHGRSARTADYSNSRDRASGAIRIRKLFDPCTLQGAWAKYRERELGAAGCAGKLIAA
jgi:hypothetical protein